MLHLAVLFKKMVILLCLLIATWLRSCAQPNENSYKWEEIDGMKLFYRTAGNPANPVLVLLHGFPSSSIMYQELMQRLKNKFYLIAPDYPAHGYSSPPPAAYSFTFDNISHTIDLLLSRLAIHKYSLYMQDYGSPIGFRLALQHPENIEALIIQNGNAYIDGFPEARDTLGELQQYWKDKNKTYEKNWIAYYRNFYEQPPYNWKLNNQVNPDRRVLDAAVMLKPGRLELFMQLWFDYGNNVKNYPAWHDYLKKYQPPVLITWGKEDTYFTVPGAIAYLKDLPKAEIHLLNGGHWAVCEQNTEQIAELIQGFFIRNKIHKSN
ncbi:alpha/beta fold hydrolase [Flavitalea flava]